jgi:hypothetical protein
MKLTEKHVSEAQLNRLINWFVAFPYGNQPDKNGLLESLLELKQRRAEDREAKRCKKS